MTEYCQFNNFLNNNLTLKLIKIFSDKNYYYFNCNNNLNKNKAAKNIR